ncbi:MAG: hypothetical protein ACOC9Z_08510 [Chloroflexota bacterium]
MDTGSVVMSRARVTPYLAEARARVEAAGEAFAAGALMQAMTYLNEARALQQEAVAALAAECWENVLCGARDEDPRRREEALNDLIQLTNALLEGLCSECRKKVGLQLQAGDER